VWDSGKEPDPRGGPAGGETRTDAEAPFVKSQMPLPTTRTLFDSARVTPYSSMCCVCVVWGRVGNVTAKQELVHTSFSLASASVVVGGGEGTEFLRVGRGWGGAGFFDTLVASATPNAVSA